MKVFLFKAIITISQTMSLQGNRHFAGLLASLAWFFAKKNKRITKINIEKCFPKLSQKEQLKLAKNTIKATLMNMMELGLLWKPTTKVENYIDNVYGIDDFSKSLADGKGLLLAAPHIGNWEVLNLLLAQFDKFAFLYKPPSDKKVEELLVKYRGKSNATQIEANLKGVRKIMKHLKNQGFVAILPDQRPKSGQGVFAPFYHIPTYTMTLFSKLAAKTKVPVYFAYALRTKNGFDVFFEKSSNDIYQDIDASVTYMNKKIQSIVDKAPEQYQWTYKRFSIQPDGNDFYLT